MPVFKNTVQSTEMAKEKSRHCYKKSTLKDNERLAIHGAIAMAF